MADSEIPTPDINSAGDEPATPRVKAGQLLREARERARLSVAKVASDLRVSPALVEALEAGDYSRFAGAPYVRALMVSMSRHLRLDPKDVLAAYGAETGSEPAAPTAVSPYKDDSKTHARAHKQIFILLLAVLLFVLLLIMGKVNSSSPGDEEPASSLPKTDTLLSLDPVGDADSLALDSLRLDSASVDSLNASGPSGDSAATVSPVAATKYASTEKDSTKVARAPKQPTAVHIRALSDTVYIRVLRAGRRESSRTLAPGESVDIRHDDVITFITRASNTVEVMAGSTVVIPDKRRFKVSGTDIAY